MEGLYETKIAVGKIFNCLLNIPGLDKIRGPTLSHYLQSDYLVSLGIQWNGSCYAISCLVTKLYRPNALSTTWRLFLLPVYSACINKTFTAEVHTNVIIALRIPGLYNFQFIGVGVRNSVLPILCSRNGAKVNFSGQCT